MLVYKNSHEKRVYSCQLIWLPWRNWLQRWHQQERLKGNRPFAACHSLSTKPPCWDAKVALGQDKQKFCMPLVGLAPVRLLRTSMAVLYHVNGKLQRAYSWILCKTTTLHVQHIFLHISLPSLYDYDMKSPSSTSWVNVNKRWRNFSLSLAFNLDMVLRNSTPEEFACIRQRRWVGIIAIEIEKLQVSPCKRCFPRSRRRGILNSLLHDMEGLNKSGRLVL